MELTEAAAQAVVPIRAEDTKTLTVFARNPQEMNVAQAQLVRWSASKIADVQGEVADLKENTEIAVRNGWRSTTLKRQLSRAEARLRFYEKVKAALDAGYCIVPGFPIDVFAIRTDKGEPAGRASHIDTPPLRAPSLNDQQSESPPLGAGDYVSPQATTMESRRPAETTAGHQQRTEITVWADAFREVDFPFTFAQPAVLQATEQAMAARIFDELGVSPTRQRRAAGDPMVIGRIYAPGGERWQRESRSVSFVVAWFLRPDRDLNF